jgi:hypothetical protein
LLRSRSHSCCSGSCGHCWLAGWRGCWLAGGVVGWLASNILICLINFYRIGVFLEHIYKAL